MKKSLKGGVLVILVLLLGYGYMVWNNNRDIPAPDQAGIALEKGIQWLYQNKASILDRQQSNLWHFIQQAGQLTGDARLLELFKAYDTRYLRNRFALWRPLFYPGSWVPVKKEAIAALPYYNKHFIYAITCDADLGQDPDIAAQNAPDFCNSRPLQQACVTHQLIGIRLLQRGACGEPTQLKSIVQQLQRRIIRQLTWDPRIIDIYLQRVLMLAESGAAASIKPIWIQNVMDSQWADGGWSGREALIPLSGDHYLLFSHRGFAIDTVDSDFHATAQGVLLLSILTRVPLN